MLFSSLPVGAFQRPITSSSTLTFNLNYLFLQQFRFSFPICDILTHPVNFSVRGNRSARRKPTTFGRVLTNSFHMNEALSSSNVENVLTENRTRNLRDERRALWPLRHRFPGEMFTWRYKRVTREMNILLCKRFVRETRQAGRNFCQQILPPD